MKTRISIAAIFALLMGLSSMSIASASEKIKSTDWFDGLAAELSKQENVLFRDALDSAYLLSNLGIKNDEEARTQLLENSLFALGIFLKPGNKWVYLKKDEKAGMAFLRMEMASGGVSFVKVKYREEKEKVSIRDWFDYSTGLWLSEKLQVLMPGYAEEKFPELTLFLMMYESGATDDAWEFISELSKSMSLPVWAMVVQLQIAVQRNKNEVETVLDNMSKNYPGDSRHQVMLIDYYYMTGRYDKIFKLLSTMEGVVGEDAALETIKATLYLERKDSDSTIDGLKKAIRLDPAYEQAYWTLLSALAQFEFYKQGVVVLDLLEKKFNYHLDASNLAELEGLDKLIKSDEFASWSSENRKKLN
ncbi:MAG: hypothetical protein OEZ47_12555 [Gammaproteobacteria bacterium]|nr:hypothetical protein [Gammaproteobacteria bacterium]